MSTLHSIRPQPRATASRARCVEERLADAEPPAGGLHEEILEVEAGPREPRRVVVEEERETHGLAARFREDHLGEALRSEEMLLEELRVGVAILGLPFVQRRGRAIRETIAGTSDGRASRRVNEALLIRPTILRWKV